jgi:hypothetical protein
MYEIGGSGDNKQGEWAKVRVRPDPKVVCFNPFLYFVSKMVVGWMVFQPFRRFVVCRSLGSDTEYTLMRRCRRWEEWSQGRAIFGESVVLEIDACGDLFEAGWHIHRYSFVREVLNVH